MLENLKLGIANLSEGYSIQPTHFSKNNKYFDKVFEAGIRSLEIADRYVNIGEYLAKTPHKWNIQIKFRFDSSKYINNPNQYLWEIVNYLKKETYNHQVTTIMFHSILDIQNLNVEKICTELANKFGFDIKLGISIYPEQFNDHLLQYFSVFQVPFNILDKRIIELEIYKLLKESKKEIQFRSVYLRGILSNLYYAFAEKSKAYKRCFEISRNYKFNLAMLAYKFVRQFDGSATVILGADNVEQVKILNEWDKTDLNPNLFKELLNISEKNLEVIDPRYW